MQERLKRIGGYIMAGIIGAVLTSLPGRSDNPPPAGGQITRFHAGPMVSLGTGGICYGTPSLNPGNQPVCSGDWFTNSDVSALYAINSYNELVTIAGKLDNMNMNLAVLHQDNADLSAQLQKQLVAFDTSLQKSVNQEFADLPPTLIGSPAMKQFHDQVVQDAVAAMQKQAK